MSSSGGSGGTGGAASTSTAGEGARAIESIDLMLPSRLTSGSSTSVRTARSPGVREDPAAIDRRLVDRSREPVIFVILYVEKRFDARRSSTSLFFNAARELATAGVCKVSLGGVRGREEPSLGVAGVSSISTIMGDWGGEEIGLSTSE
jgi:hypothetical protein